MPPWGRSSGGLRRDVAGALGGRRMRNTLVEEIDELNGVARFQVLDSDYDEDADLAADKLGTMRNDILAAEEERRARMALVGKYDLSGYPRVGSRRYLGAQEDLAYGEDYSQLYEDSPQLQLIRQQQSELELVAQAREDDKAVEIALERIRRAKARGDSNVDLTPEEIGILQRRGLLPGFESSDVGETTSSRPSTSASRHRSGSAASAKRMSTPKQNAAAGNSIGSSPRGSSKASKPPNKRISLSSLSQETSHAAGPTLIPFPLNAGARPSTPPDIGPDDVSYRYSPRRHHGATTTATSSPRKSSSRRSSRAASLTQPPPPSSAAPYTQYPVDPRYAPEYRPASAASMYGVPPNETEWIPRTRSSSSVHQPYYYNNHARTPPAVGATVDPFIYQTGQSPFPPGAAAAAGGGGRRYASGPLASTGTGGPGAGRVVYPASAIQYSSVPRRVPAEYVSSNLRRAEDGAGRRRSKAADAEIIEISSAGEEDEDDDDDDDDDEEEEDELAAPAGASNSGRRRSRYSRSGAGAGAGTTSASSESEEDNRSPDSEEEDEEEDQPVDQGRQKSSRRSSTGKGAAAAAKSSKSHHNNSSRSGHAQTQSHARARRR